MLLSLILTFLFTLIRVLAPSVDGSREEAGIWVKGVVVGGGNGGDYYIVRHVAWGHRVVGTTTTTRVHRSDVRQPFINKV